MAVPKLVFIVVEVAKSWRFWMGLSFFATASAFSFAGMVELMSRSALNLWPLLAMVGLVIVIREIIKQYYAAKRDSIMRGRRDD